jgi:hypothetical protein
MPERSRDALRGQSNVNRGQERWRSVKVPVGNSAKSNSIALMGETVSPRLHCKYRAENGGWSVPGASRQSGASLQVPRDEGTVAGKARTAPASEGQTWFEFRIRTSQIALRLWANARVRGFIASTGQRTEAGVCPVVAGRVGASLHVPVDDGRVRGIT